MRYWWVNQNQTYRHEVPGNYLWSPKRNANGNRNPFYDFMREVAPGDVVFSFADTLIKAIGIVSSNAYEAPKPLEFGQAGAYWDNIGWRVDVRFAELRLPIRPSEHMQVLGPRLPHVYSPLQEDGRGLQGVYLTRLSELLAGALVDLLGAEARDVIRGHRAAEERPLQPAIGLVEWEEHEMNRLRMDADIPETTRKAVVICSIGDSSGSKTTATCSFHRLSTRNRLQSSVLIQCSREMSAALRKVSAAIWISTANTSYCARDFLTTLRRGAI